MLVARGVAPEEVFDAISEQAARVCGVGAGAVVRFGDAGAAIVGRWGEIAREALPPGMSFALDGGGALTLVRETGLPARFDDYAVAVGAMGAVVRPIGLRASAAAPVKVEGSVWGALIVSAFDSETLPLDTEEQLAAFTELVSIAVAGADARERLLESRARLVRPPTPSAGGWSATSTTARSSGSSARGWRCGCCARGGRTRTRSTRSSTSSARRTRSCASSRGGCTRRRSAVGCTPRSGRSPRGRRSRSNTTSSRSASPTSSRSPSTTSSARR